MTNKHFHKLVAAQSARRHVRMWPIFDRLQFSVRVINITVLRVILNLLKNKYCRIGRRPVLPDLTCAGCGLIFSLSNGKWKVSFYDVCQIKKVYKSRTGCPDCRVGNVWMWALQSSRGAVCVCGGRPSLHTVNGWGDTRAHQKKMFCLYISARERWGGYGTR